MRSGSVPAIRVRLGQVWPLCRACWLLLWLTGCAGRVLPPPDASLLLAARGGDAAAQYRMGMYYYEARYATLGKAAYWEQAAHWFEQAARQGDFRAHYRMAQYCFNVRSDYARSFHYLQLPALSGVAEAQHLLGAHHVQGWGTPPDLVQGYKWVALAFEGGLPDPVGSLMGLDWIVQRGKMTPEQIAQARHLAAEHRARHGHSRPIALLE